MPPVAKPKPGKKAGPEEARDDELFLIDGNSLAYRAFFALPESIATADGRPTNAIYGFASMMVKLLTDFKPKGVIVAWDAGWSGREKQYSEYKAQRKSRPDLLKEQWPHLAPLAEAFGFTNVKVDGYEADDVIGTLARQASGQGIPVMVVSGDRDVYQVVGDGIRVMTTSRGVTDTRIYDHEGVVDRYGVAARAGARPDRAEGGHLGQHSGVPGDRGQDGRPAAAEVRLAGGRAGLGRRDLGRQAQGEPHQPRRRRASLEAARHPPVRRRRADRPCRLAPQGAGSLAAARRRGRVRAAPGHRAAGGGVRRDRPRPRGRRDDPGRGPGGLALPTSPRGRRRWRSSPGASAPPTASA